MFKMKKKAKNNMVTIVPKPSFSLLQCEWVKKKNPAMGSLYVIIKSNN